jgi:hypothetical protein
MAKARKGPAPRFYVSDAHKEAMAEQVIAQTVFSLDRLGSEPGAPLADDLMDMFGRAFAAALAADTNLNTPAKLRDGVEAVAVHVVGHLKRYVEEQRETGISTLQRMIAAHPIPEEMKRAWNDS